MSLLEWFLDCRVRVGYRRVGAWVVEKTLKRVSTIPRDAVTHKDIQPNERHLNGASGRSQRSRSSLACACVMLTPWVGWSCDPPYPHGT